MSVGDVRRRGSHEPILRILLLVLLPITVALAGCAASSRHGPRAAATPSGRVGAAAPGTSTVMFHPYTADGRLAVASDGVVHGQCWTTSIAAPGATAYRCFQGNKILDPCFAPASRAVPLQLACLATPWSRALLLQVNGNLPTPDRTGAAGRPWAIQLSSGVRCVASTGTVPAVAGVNLTYHCADGGNAAISDTGGPSLTARYASAAARTLASLTVTTVWDA